MQEYCTKNNVLFLITFKKAVYSQSQKIKLRDLERQMERDDFIDETIKYIKNRLKNS
jgi:hypothetical protein